MVIPVGGSTLFYMESDSMELGNLAFGHSRGNYPADRSRFEEAFGTLFALMRSELCTRESFGHLPAYSCEVFEYRPYFWGECDCPDEEPHQPGCPEELPNFLHKPTGFEIRWYKYPFRDSYTNVQVTDRQLFEIVCDCIDAFRKDCRSKQPMTAERKKELLEDFKALRTRLGKTE